jgi:hypothetical protein
VRGNTCEGRSGGEVLRKSRTIFATPFLFTLFEKKINMDKKRGQKRFEWAEKNRRFPSLQTIALVELAHFLNVINPHSAGHSDMCDSIPSTMSIPKTLMLELSEACSLLAWVSEMSSWNDCTRIKCYVIRRLSVPPFPSELE